MVLGARYKNSPRHSKLDRTCHNKPVILWLYKRTHTLTNMKKIFLLLAIAFLAGAMTQAQVTCFTLQYGFTYEADVDAFSPYDDLGSMERDQRRWDLGLSGFALGWKGKNGRLQSIESMPLRISHTMEEAYAVAWSSYEILYGAKLNRFGHYTRYRYRWFTFTPGDCAADLYLEVAGTLHGTWNKAEPLHTFEYPYNELDLSLAPGVIPGVEWRLGERLLLDVSIPLEPVELGFTRLHTDNPGLTVSERTTSKFSVIALNRWMVRVGFGVTL